MEKQLLVFLSCPICQSELSLTNCPDTAEIISGYLVCSQKHYFAIKNGVPILRADLAIASAIPFKKEERNDFNKFTTQQRAKLLRPFVESLINFSKAKTSQAKKSLEDDVTYRLHYSRKDKYVKLIQPLLKEKPTTILELGMGQGGFTTSLKEIFKPKLIVGLDFDPDWAQVAKIKDPRINVVVADATRLPFKDNSFDLIASAYLLEHVVQWEKTIDETKRVGQQSFFIFGPNKRFPWDYGHFRNAPLITYFSPKIGKYIAYLIAKWKGFDDSLTECETELRNMNYLTPKKFENCLRSKNLSYQDIFNQFVEITLNESYHYWRLGYLLKKIKKTTIWLLKILHFLNLHPFLVYFWNKNTNAEFDKPI